MRIGEAHSLLRQTIQIRSRDFRGRVITPDIPVAQIIGEDEDDIRRGVRHGALNEQKGSSQASEGFHGLPLSCPLRGLALKFPLVALRAPKPEIGMLRSRLRQTPSGRTLSPSDPDLIRNVAFDPKFSQTFPKRRARVKNWMSKTNDPCAKNPLENIFGRYRYYGGTPKNSK